MTFTPWCQRRDALPQEGWRIGEVVQVHCAFSRQQQSGVITANLLEAQVSFIAVDLIICMFEDDDFGGGRVTPQFPDQGLNPSPSSESI